MKLLSRFKKEKTPEQKITLVTNVQLSDIVDVAASDTANNLGPVRPYEEIEAALQNSGLLGHLLIRGLEIASERGFDNEAKQRVGSAMLYLGNLTSAVTERRELEEQFKLTSIPRKEQLVTA